MAEKLLNRNYLLLWQGQLVSQMGSQAFLVAAMFWITETTGSASLVGVFMMITALPGVLFGPIGGTIADWFPRRSILIVTDVLSGLSVLSLAAVMYLRPESLDVIFVWLFVVALLCGALRAFFVPAISASIPDIVPMKRLATANAMNQFSVQLSAFLGQGAGGVLFRLLGAPLLFLFDGLSYLFSAISEMFISIPHHRESEKLDLRGAFSTFWRDTREGLAYVWGRVGLRSLLLSASALNFFVMPVVVLLPFFVRLQLQRGADWYGFLLAAISAGSILGFVLAGGLGLAGKTRAWAMIGSLVGASLLFGGIGIAENRFVALAFATGIGVCTGFINVQLATLIQSSTPTALRGRTMGLVVTLATAIMPVGMALGGVLGDLLDKNFPLIYGICGGVSTVAMLVSAGNRAFREFLAGAELVQQNEPGSGDETTPTME